ncbi:recombinase family protein, partial [bacterium]|nr:recombinase family protein [bacterium]
MSVHIYARQSSDRQDSNPDQVRVDVEWAERNGLIVSPDNIYCDSESGQMASRPAWQALRAAVRSGQIDVVICHSQSRMFRDLQEAIEFRNEAREHGVRIVFAAEDMVLGDDELSQQGFEFRAVMDQGQARALANHVRTAQETLFLDGKVFGTITYGYKGVPVEG